MEEIGKIVSGIRDLKQKFEDNYDPNPGKSFLKSGLKQYLDCLPDFKEDKLDKLMKLLEKDAVSITEAIENLKS